MIKYKHKTNPENPYIVDGDLLEAIELALFLKRPLLLQGEPGCGKTQLAKSIAYSLYYDKKAKDDWKNYFFEWHIKSTSKARDGFYTFDNLARLRDAQLAGSNQLDSKELAKSKIPDTYVRMGEIGKAFRTEKQAVLLIDEIDKADLDFPNDMLLELDEKRFVIQEVDEKSDLREVTAKHSPLILITSNNEKPLPNAFLRRCLYFNLTFPSHDKLIEILAHHCNDGKVADDMKIVVEKFEELRNNLRHASGKRLSTSELIDWYSALKAQIPNFEERLKSGDEIPGKSILLKNFELLQAYQHKNL
jgi:MoxR-like ATPase